MSIPTSDPHPPRMDRHAVRAQFARRAADNKAQFLHDEIARRMAERLALIKTQPAQVLDCGCGQGQGWQVLTRQYDQARYTGVDISAAQIQRAQNVTQSSGWLDRWKTRGRKAFAVADAASLPFPAQHFDLIWSNLMLHWHPAPHQVFPEWFRVLRSQGLLMFSCFGPDTLKELRSARQAAGLHLPSIAFVDMHDLGDMMVESGFSTPVLDQEVITLRYRDAQRLLDDVRALGGNAAPDRSRTLHGRATRQRLLAALEAQRNAQGDLLLSVEVAYGHAWRVEKPAPSSTEVRIPLAALGGRKRG